MTSRSHIARRQAARAAAPALKGFMLCFGSKAGTLDIEVWAADRFAAGAQAPALLADTVKRPEDWVLNAVQAI